MKSGGFHTDFMKSGGFIWISQVKSTRFHTDFTGEIHWISRVKSAGFHTDFTGEIRRISWSFLNIGIVLSRVLKSWHGLKQG